MNKLLIALQFLTIFPVRIKGTLKEKDLAASLAYFPLAGLFIGILSWLVFFCLSRFLSVQSAVMIALAVSVVCSGGMHLDGLADTADGFYAGKDKEHTLSIMRDSRIGAMGVIAIVLILLLKVSLLTGLSLDAAGKVLIMMHVFSRWSMVLACYRLDYARAEGKAGAFMRYASKKEVIVSGAICVSVFLAAGGIKGIAVFLSGLVPVFGFMQLSRKKINGMSGDTLGALNEVAEVSALFFSALLLKI
ncbi:MAG: adenosylcobinamide-GDP ribazoletransferase [Candidatus Omnitrophica bacterium]|nr:adenosylcobinamide-GDP ribazoletransferase [Candidatus Omnitrophota bacterium]